MATEVSSSTHSPQISSPSSQPSTADNPTFPPLNVGPTRRTSTQRPPSFAKNRLSSFSTGSKSSNVPASRPMSHVIPIFHSSLPYTLVRDFAFPLTHPHHYGPPPTSSGLSTPASEARRLSDPAVTNWDDGKEQWSAAPPWTTETNASSSYSREQLPAMTFSDGGPPYSEDEDLHSPVVTTARHKKQKSSMNERGKSPNDNRGSLIGVNGDGSETYYVNEGGFDDADGPGGELVTYPPEQARHSHFSPNYPPQQYLQAAHQRAPLSYNYVGESEDETDDDDETRFSRNYSFTIASPDEEMHGKAVALFDFAREHENELPLKEGQVILVSYRHGQGWLVAEDPKTGESGLVPEEFVRLLRDIEGGLNGLQNVEGGVESLSIDASAANAVAETPDPEMDSLATPKHSRADWQHRQSQPQQLQQQQQSQPPPSQPQPQQPQQPQPQQSTSSEGSSGAGNGDNVAADRDREKHQTTAVQSSFSTSSRDLDPYPLHDVIAAREREEREKGTGAEKAQQDPNSTSIGGITTTTTTTATRSNHDHDDDNHNDNDEEEEEDGEDDDSGGGSGDADSL